MDYSSFILRALKEASEISDAYFGEVKGVTKDGDNNQVLTEADLTIGNHLVTSIRAAYPEHNIIDEEAGVIDNGSSLTWVIDPIDGTSNFAEGLPFYGVMIGILEKGSPVAGGVALPYFNEVYSARKGGGAFCNGERIAVTDSTELLSSLVAYGIDGHQEDPDITYAEMRILGEIILNIRNLRTSNSAYDMVMVARGRYGAYLNRTTRIWDNVPHQIIIEEAGGLYTDFLGNAMDYCDPVKKVNQNFTVCASPPELHKQLQSILKK